MKLRLVTFFLLFFTIGFSQRNAAKKDIGVDYNFKKEFYGGVRLQTNGFSLYIEHGWIKDIYRTNLLNIEYQYFFDAKELKQQALGQGGKNYVYGLQNKFHILRASYGFERVIADKADRNGVKLSFVGFVGVTLGILKPYYYEMVKEIRTYEVITEYEKYNGSADAHILAKDSIYGAAPYRIGMNQMLPMPGGHVKAALNFDWGKRDAFVRALELGVLVDVYYKKVPIMVNNTNNAMIHPSLYLGVHLGKRW